MASEQVVVIESIGKILGSLGGFIVALKLTHVGLKKWAVRRAKIDLILTALERIQKDVAGINDRVVRIEGFVGPNGGKSLLDSQARIETTVQFLHEVVAMEQPWPTFRASPSGHVEWANDRFVDLVGMTPNQLAGNGWISAIAEGDRQRVSEEWVRCVQGRRMFKMRFAVITAEAREMVVSCTAIPVDLRGEVRCIAGKLEPHGMRRRRFDERVEGLDG